MRWALVAMVALTAAAVLGVVRIMSLDTRSAPAQPAEDVEVAARLPDTAHEAEAAPRPNPQQAAQREWLAMSPSYRATSLVIAIRDAGFVCSDVLSVDQSADGHAAWRVACDGALAYLVGVGSGGGINVDIVPYGDHLAIPFSPEAEDLDRFDRRFRGTPPELEPRPER